MRSKSITTVVIVLIELARGECLNLRRLSAYFIANKQRAGLWGSTSERGLKVFVRYMAITRVE